MNAETMSLLIVSLVWAAFMPPQKINIFFIGNGAFCWNVTAYGGNLQTKLIQYVKVSPGSTDKGTSESYSLELAVANFISEICETKFV